MEVIPINNLSLSGKVQTVTGVVPPSALGKTMVHEHLSMNFDVAFVKPIETDVPKSTMPFSMETLGWIRYNPYSHQPNLHLNGTECEQAIIAEMKHYHSVGGGSIVECTTHGISRKAQFLYDVSLLTGVNIIAGTGYYVAASQDSKLFVEPIEKLAEVMRTEQTEGCLEAPTIRCGLIGEIGCSYPIHNFEKRVLEAAAIIQNELKCPVSIHPGRNPASPAQVLRHFLEAGGKADQVSLCHLDRTLIQDEHVFDFAAMGSYLEFDLFGVECSHYQLNGQIDMPSDAQRINRLYQLIVEGYGDKLLISHDIHTKHRLVKFGGHGYSHILENIVPRILQRGIDNSSLEKILVENPFRWLTYL
ncbi:hypothetical protein DAPPUDRAFT_187750 [Daphnia pulex]|uniref:Uncharacterized protein n=1 Tax=Daphnia pulex TaxID=6669 RepID=E9G753_DAPPU|nr:hypothetical protein DAPPUDRAFT_187750 [Daphnia pulex]|eukprot:EFX84407.1 hypothetical protein DAPPUDRAFT_187750 [Daphnia pulex]